jgi:hypothetical protein
MMARKGQTDAYVRKLEKDAAMGRELMEQQSLREFVEAFKTSLGIVAAITPFDKWPKEFLKCFKSVSAEYPTSAELYKARLPIK